MGVKSATAKERVLSRLRLLVEDGSLPLHSRLPPERDLSEKFAVSRVTLRKALDVLEAEGKISRGVGSGTFIGASLPDDKAGLSEFLEAATPQELLEARAVIEPSIAAEAASRARSSDIAFMRTCLEKREAAPNPELYEKWDHNLHRAVAEATGNRVLVGMMKALNVLRQQPEWKAYRNSTVSPTRREDSAIQHRNIVEAIIRRDRKSAFETMRNHIVTIQGNTNWSEGAPRYSEAAVTTVKRAKPPQGRK